MKILLINPRCNKDFIHEPATIMLPNNLLILAGYGRSRGHDFRILDMNLDKSFLVPTLQDWSPDIVGITVMTGPTIKNALEVSKTARKLLPAAKIVWGGVHPTLLPEQVLKDSFIDIVVIRDGERTLANLADALSSGTDISGVSGIAYRQADTVRFTPPQSLIHNLNELPDPAWDLVDIKRYMKHFPITLNTSRGCPFCCTFCYNQVMNGKRRAELSAERVFNQVEYFYRIYGVQNIDFLEDNFMANWQRIESFCNLMIKFSMPVKWSCEGRITDVNREQLQLMKNAGCSGIRFGIESGSPRILKFIKKGITIDSVRRVLNECKDIGLTTTMYLIMGIPTETEQDRKASLRLMDEFPNTNVDLVIYRPYPGTELFDYCIKEGLFTLPNKTSEWAKISDQYDPRFSVNRNAVRNIWICQLKSRLHNYRRSSIPYSLTGNLRYRVKLLPLYAEYLGLLLHIPPKILVKPARFLVNSMRKIYYLFRNSYKEKA